jgi:hypothetical protein
MLFTGWKKLKLKKINIANFISRLVLYCKVLKTFYFLYLTRKEDEVYEITGKWN